MPHRTLLRTFTLLSSKTDSILRYLSSIARSPDTTAVFALSSNAQPLEPIVTALRQLSDRHVGCLCAPLPYATSQVVCSVSVLANEEAHIIRSVIPGRKQAQVGRWRMPDREDHPALDDEAPILPADWKWDALWNQKGLPAVRSQWQYSGLPETGQFIFFSDNSPEGLISVMNEQVPKRVVKMGLVGSPTPFVTGRPFTLFHNTNISSSGSVGIFIKTISARASVAFGGFSELSAPMRVTDSEGNLVHTLDRTNPTNLLLSALKSENPAADPTIPLITKEQTYYLGIPDSLTASQKNYLRVYRITSGDPSRGSISLDAEDGVPVGTHVQFLRRADDSGSNPGTPLLGGAPTTASIFKFLATSDELPSDPRKAALNDHASDITVLEDVFLAASEHGFITSSVPGMPSQTAKCWRSSVLGATASVELAK